MSHLHDIGEEYGIKNGLETTFDVGLYEEATDQLADSDGLAAITTEPDTAQTYARDAIAFSYETVSADGASTNDTEIAWDLSGNSQDVDAWFIVANFTSERAGDGSATDHLIASGSLGQDFVGGATAGIRLDPSEIGVSIN